MSRPRGSGFAVSKSISEFASSMASDFLYPTAFMPVLPAFAALQKGYLLRQLRNCKPVEDRLPETGQWPARLMPVRKRPQQPVQCFGRWLTATFARCMSAFGLALDRQTSRSTVPIYDSGLHCGVRRRMLRPLAAATRDRSATWVDRIWIVDSRGERWLALLGVQQ